jgi:MarR family 2-MHQ and catechol resistance regulon transcriptional repressor
MNESRDLMLSEALIGTLHLVVSRLELALEPLGLSLPKFKVLGRLVAAGEPLPLGTLAEQSACVRSNITQLIDRLEADKLVARVDDPRDRRSIRAELTAEGRKRHAEAARVLKAAERELFAGLGQEQRDSLLHLLGSLRGQC